MIDPRILEQEGREARLNDAPASGCPYTFDKSEYWDSKDHDGFNTVRWKLDAWMRGWLQIDKRIRDTNDRGSP